jgi:hypothetical protein
VTASDTKSPAKARGAVNAMQTYMTSLLYLRQEARRDGLDAVADILWRALAAIEAWLDSGQAPVGSGDILDADSDEENRSFRAEDDQKFAKRRW